MATYKSNITELIPEMKIDDICTYNEDDLTEAFRKTDDPELEFVFVDGPHEGNPFLFTTEDFGRQDWFIIENKSKYLSIKELATDLVESDKLNSYSLLESFNELSAIVMISIILKEGVANRDFLYLPLMDKLEDFLHDGPDKINSPFYNQYLEIKKIMNNEKTSDKLSR